MGAKDPSINKNGSETGGETGRIWGMFSKATKSTIRATYVAQSKNRVQGGFHNAKTSRQNRFRNRKLMLGSSQGNKPCAIRTASVSSIRTPGAGLNLGKSATWQFANHLLCLFPFSLFPSSYFLSSFSSFLPKEAELTDQGPGRVESSLALDGEVGA